MNAQARMEEHELREKIQRLISRNKTEEVFELLSSIQFSKADKQLIILNSQYNKVKEELRLNLISREEGERKVNQINMALLDLSQAIKSGKVRNSGLGIDGEKGGFNKKLLWLLLLPLVLIGYFIVENQKPPQLSEAEQKRLDDSTRAVIIADSIQLAKEERLEEILTGPNLVAHFSMDNNQREMKSKTAASKKISLGSCENRHQEKNKATAFDGRNSYLEYDKLFLPVEIDEDGICIAFWIWVEKKDGGHAVLGQFPSASHEGYVGTNHFISIIATGTIGIDEYKSTIPGYSGQKYEEGRESRSLVPQGEWVHVVIMRSLKGEKYYVNGLEMTVTTDNEQYVSTFGQPARTIFGMRPRIGLKKTDYFKGKLDDVLFFDTALDPETIKFLSTM